MATILLVDDEENILRLCREELEECGYKVICATNGREAIEQVIRDVTAGNYNIDLVVLDVSMPGVNGREVLKALKGAVSSMPVIIHTAYDYTNDNIIMFGADEYLTKSSDLTRLKNTIRRLLGKK